MRHGFRAIRTLSRAEMKNVEFLRSLVAAGASTKPLIVQLNGTFFANQIAMDALNKLSPPALPSLMPPDGMIPGIPIRLMPKWMEGAMLRSRVEPARSARERPR